MNLTDAADVAGIDWKTAKRIDKKYLSRLVTGLDAVYPTKLGVDEIARVPERIGHNYLTVVRDLDIGRVIWVGQTRRKETLDAFFTELGAPKSSQIQVFVMDTWDPYIASVHENTNAVIVFDLFHVARKITEAVCGQGAPAGVRQCGRGNAQEVQEDTFSDSEAREEVGCDAEKRETLNALMVDNERLYCIRRIY